MMKKKNKKTFSSFLLHPMEPSPSSLLLSLLSLLLLLSLTSASRGDQSSTYQLNVNLCTKACNEAETDLGFVLTSLGWTCRSNCQYTIMREITEKRAEKGEQIHQYFGKWPFIRILGLQEPASVVFSIGNLLTHLLCLHRYLTRVPSVDPMRTLWLLYSCVAVNTWFWSTIYHGRDLPWTEILDYFSATFSVGFAAYCAAVRVFHLSRRSSQGLAVFGLFLYWRHCAYLLSRSFDYGYNMKVTIIAGLLGNVIWLYWHFRDRRSYGKKVLAAIFVLLLLMSLELGDFPPLFDVLDAHAIWHASTIPWALLWNSFVIDDSRYECELIHQKTKAP